MLPRLVGNEATIDDRLDVFRFDLQSLFEVRASFLAIALGQPGKSAVVESLRMLRVDLDGGEKSAMA